MQRALPIGGAWTNLFRGGRAPGPEPEEAAEGLEGEESEETSTEKRADSARSVPGS